MEHYLQDLKRFIKSKRFMACVILIAALCYGFAAINVTIGIDDLEDARYTGEGNTMLSAGRFGTYLLTKLSSTWDSAYMTDFISVGMLILAAINYCILFSRIAGDRIRHEALIVFACIFVSYPLMNEIWEYTGTNIIICGSFLMISFVLLIMHQQIHRGLFKKPSRLLAAALLMMLVCAGYESLVPVYVFFVCALLTLLAVYGDGEEKTLKEVVRQALVYASVLVAGLLLRVIVHRLILLLPGIDSFSNGATTILWGEYPAVQLVKSLLFGWFSDYILRGIVYFPLTELVVAGLLFLIIGICACRKHGAALLLPGFGMLLSLVLLSIIQGSVSPYRTCQVFSVFVSFVTMIAVNWLCTRQGKRALALRTGALILSAYLCFCQAAFLNYFLDLNHVRSEEEAYTVRSIGTDLYAQADMEKPVIFVGGYELSDYVQEAASIPEDSMRWKLYSSLYIKLYSLIDSNLDFDTLLTRKLPHTNVSSVIAWGTQAYKQEAMQNLFHYYGFNYVLADYDTVYEDAREYATQTDMPAYPQAGYIQDAGDYIIVRLSK